MTIPNRMRLEQAIHLPAADFLKLPTQSLELLLEDIADHAQKARAGLSLVTMALHERFGRMAADARKAIAKDTGTVTLIDDERKIVADLPKKVEWDQAKLAAAVKALVEEWEENPADYVVTEYKIPETKWNAWPPKIQALFADARTVRVGKATYKIEPIKGDA